MGRDRCGAKVEALSDMTGPFFLKIQRPIQLLLA